MTRWTAALIVVASLLLAYGVRQQCFGAGKHQQAVDSLDATRPADEAVRDSLQRVAEAALAAAAEAEARALAVETRLSQREQALRRASGMTDSLAAEVEAGRAEGVTWRDLYYRRTSELAEAQGLVQDARRQASDFKTALDHQKAATAALQAKIGRLEPRLTRTEQLLKESKRGCRLPVISVLHCPVIGPGVVVSKEGVDLGVAAIVPVGR